MIFLVVLASKSGWQVPTCLQSVHSRLSWWWVQVAALAGVLQRGGRGQGPRQAQVLSDLAKNMKALRDAFAAEIAQRG